MPFGTPLLGWTELSRAGLATALRLMNEGGQDGVRDELGFGGIHFAYSDRFFPGTSVLQTRPRYVWLVCWAYQEMAERYRGRPFAPDALREIEVRIGRRLWEGLGDDKPEGCGIIGWRRYQVGKSPVVMPSRIYWNALKQWQVLRPQLPSGLPPDQSDLQSRWEVLVPDRRGREGEGAMSAELFTCVPSRPADWGRRRGPLSLDLCPKEADMLRQRLASTRGADGQRSLLAIMAEHGVGARAAAPWAPEVAALASPGDRVVLERARLAASLVCLGRALYAAMIEDLQQNDGISEDRRHRAELDDLLIRHRDAATALDVALLAKDGVDLSRGFDDLLKRIQDWASQGGSFDHLKLPFLLRETRLKGSRAALAPSARPRRANWRQPYAAQPLDYRWPIVKRCLADLQVVT